MEGNERLRFKSYVESTRGLINSRVPEIVCIVAVYAIVVGFVIYVPSEVFPEWAFVDGRLSWAGSWSMFVSAPLLLILFFAWLWRILLWGRFSFAPHVCVCGSSLHIRTALQRALDCLPDLRN